MSQGIELVNQIGINRLGNTEKQQLIEVWNDMN